MKIDIFLTEDMVFEYGKMKIKVIELPGHTKGSVGFIINNNFFGGSNELWITLTFGNNKVYNPNDLCPIFEKFIKKIL